MTPCMQLFMFPVGYMLLAGPLAPMYLSEKLIQTDAKEKKTTPKRSTKDNSANLNT